MALFAETEQKIFGDILFDIVESTNITRSSRGSKTRAIAQALSKKLGQMYRKFDINIAQAFLDGAEGRYLEFIGDLLGVERLGAEPARVASTERNVRFYVNAGNFGSINSGQPITITAGTRISTGVGGTGIVYIVPFTTVLSASVSEAYVAVQALRPGSVSNLGARQLNNHDFNSYAQAVNDSLKVTNDAEIRTGQDIELETNYKFRIANQVTAAEKANPTAVRLAALSVPGVADIAIIPFFKGIGSSELLIKATTPSVPAGLIEAVSEAVDDVVSQGLITNIRAPNETGFSLTGRLTLRRVLPINEQQAIINAVTDNIIDYTNSLDIGEDWIENEAIERVMSASEEIKNVGRAGKPFENKFLYKNSKLEDNKIRSSLVGDYSPEEDERVIVENTDAGTTPILFTVI